MKGCVYFPYLESNVWPVSDWISWICGGGNYIDFNIVLITLILWYSPTKRSAYITTHSNTARVPVSVGSLMNTILIQIHFVCKI